MKMNKFLKKNLPLTLKRLHPSGESHEFKCLLGGGTSACACHPDATTHKIRKVNLSRSRCVGTDMKIIVLILFLVPIQAFAEKPSNYAWVGSNEVSTQRIDEQFQPPKGFSRVVVGADDFGTWLRGLPLRQDRSVVKAYDGRDLNSPSAAVVLMDVGHKDLQQCADTAIRLYAEWKWARGQADELLLHFTSGDVAGWKAWRTGVRWSVKGNQVSHRQSAATDASYSSFKNYLALVFTYAGTRSLPSDSVAVNTAMPGDFYVQSGSPGHAVVVLDVAEDSAGRRVALLGQGFMPAQELHVLKSSGARVLKGVWFLLPDADHTQLKTPSWKAFEASDLRRFK